MFKTGMGLLPMLPLGCARVQGKRLQALVPGIPIHHPLLSMQQLCHHGHIVDVGTSDSHGMDQARSL